MTDQQRHDLYLAIMTSAIPDPLPEDFKELGEMAVEEVERLEPLIDDWLAQAELKGRLEALLQQAYMQQVPIMELKRKIEEDIHSH